MNDPFITESYKVWDEKCEASDIMGEWLDRSVDDLIKEGDVTLIADAFDGEHDPRQMAEDYLAGDKAHDSRVREYLREIAEMEYE